MTIIVYDHLANLVYVDRRHTFVDGTHYDETKISSYCGGRYLAAFAGGVGEAALVSEAISAIEAGKAYAIVPKELTAALNGAEALLKDGDTGRVYFLTTGEGVILIEHLTNFIALGSGAPVARRHWAEHQDPGAAAIIAAQFAEACGGPVDQF